jgi:hypothetical protein
MSMYQYWHYGDTHNKQYPTSQVCASVRCIDIDYLDIAAKIRLCELKKVMTAIEKLLPKAFLPLNTWI